MDTPSHRRITEWVKGLEMGGNAPCCGIGDNRLFLMTIACEGGLPLRLLQRENAHLTQFFRTVLENYYQAGQGGEAIAETIARQQAHHLPLSLRRRPVFHLAATLIATIGRLPYALAKRRTRSQHSISSNRTGGGCRYGWTIRSRKPC